MPQLARVVTPLDRFRRSNVSSSGAAAPDFERLRRIPAKAPSFGMESSVSSPLREAHDEMPTSTPVPLGDCAGELRVIRGGSWYFNADSARCGLRYTHRPQDVGISLGLRLVREIPA